MEQNQRSIKLNKEEVFKAATQIFAAGKFPTLAAIRAYLGNRGSQTTIHKYFSLWKQACYQATEMRMTIGEEQDKQISPKEKSHFNHIIEEQMILNAKLSAQIYQLNTNLAHEQEITQSLAIQLQLLQEKVFSLEEYNDKLS